MLKCRGMGKVRKGYAEGGAVNAAQRASGPTLFQATERKRKQAIEEQTEGRATPQGLFASRQTMSKAPTGRQKEQLAALLKKRDAEFD